MEPEQLPNPKASCILLGCLPMTTPQLHWEDRRGWTEHWPMSQDGAALENILTTASEVLKIPW